MTTPPTFPSLAGLGWPVKKTPTFSNIVVPHASGREVRAALYRNPIWDFELTIEGLSGDATSYPGLGASTLQALMDLFLTCQGGFSTFLYVDPSDCAASAQVLANGDGATKSFAFARQLKSAGFLEPVGWVTSVAHVYLAGVDQTTGWSLTTPNTLSFGTAPPSGVAISASFSYAFQCRFADDTLEFSEMMQNLWEVKSVKFRSVRPQ